MEIHQRITYRFMVIIACLLFGALLTVYLLFSSFRKDEFTERLHTKAYNVGELIGKDSSSLDDLEWLIKSKFFDLTNECIQIYDTSLQMLFSFGESDGSGIDQHFLLAAKTNKEYRQSNKPYEAFAFYYEKDDTQYLIVCSAIDVFGYRKLKKMQYILILVFFVSLLAVYFPGKVFSIKSLSPISRIVEQVNTISISNISSRLKLSGEDDDINRLAITFNEMLDRLENSFKTQKDFISNASHELRTPLTAITGQLEVTLLQDREKNEYISVINSVLEDIKSLNNLTNRLLILSRAGNNFTDEGFFKIRIDDILWKSRSDILRHNENYQVNILFHESIKDEQHLNILGNEQLLKTAFSNLIENGCKYSLELSVDIQLSVQDDYIGLQFKNMGASIPENEIQLIFQPFYRAENAQKSRGYGIGLSLVEKIIALHNGSIKVTSNQKNGTDFSIKLPLIT